MKKANSSKIEVNVFLKIFQKSMISKPLKSLLINNDNIIRKRYNEIKDFLLPEIHIKITYKKFYECFELAFKKFLFSKSIIKIDEGNDGFNMIKIIISMINEEELKYVLFSEMIVNIIMNIIEDNYKEVWNHFDEYNFKDFLIQNLI